MKISCPKCGASGNLPDHEVPEQGRFLTCPRCKHGFTVSRPRSNGANYEVDTCPACSFSTFGDGVFTACPKCGVVVKTYIERQREEQEQKRNQELLNKRLGPAAVSEPETPSVAPEEETHFDPVKLVGWGAMIAGFCIAVAAVWGVMDVDAAQIRNQLSEQREHEVSALYVFLRFSLPGWLRLAYGLTTCYVAYLFLQQRRAALRPLEILIWCLIGYVPLAYAAGYVFWLMAPIPHTLGGHLIELFNSLFVSALVGVPLYLLIGYLQERPVRSKVRY